MKKGLILEERIVMMKMEEDYDELLNSIENDEKQCVKAELIPSRGEWWNHPDTWEFIIAEESNIPVWFLANQKEYEQKFREKVTKWWHKHCIVNNNRQVQYYDHGYYLLKGCEYVNLSGDVIVRCDSCEILSVSDCVSIKKLVASNINDMSGNAEIKDMSDSFILKMRNAAGIGNCTESLIEEMKEDAHILNLKNSKIHEMYDHSCVYRKKKYVRSCRSIRYLNLKDLVYGVLLIKKSCSQTS